MEDKKDWLGIACIWILLLQKMTDFKWLYHIIWPLLLFWAYYTVKLLQAELKTENSLKGVCKYIWKNKKWDIYWLLFFIIFTIAYFAGELNK